LDAVRDLVVPMTKALDGRLDLFSNPEYDPAWTVGGDSEWDMKQKKWVEEERYTIDDRNALLVEVKTQMCHVLQRVDDLKLSNRLARFVNVFKECVGELDALSLKAQSTEKNAEAALAALPGKMKGKLLFARKTDAATSHVDLLPFQKELHTGAARWTATDDFQRKVDGLFIGAEGNGLDFSKEVADTRPIIMDLLMYEDHQLFHAATSLLFRSFAQKRNLLRVCSAVGLQHSESVAVFGSIEAFNVHVRRYTQIS
jgi:hypothetical protein